MSKKRGLGRGLETLLSGGASSAPAPTVIFEMPVSELVQGQFQPRQSVNDDDLSELVQSIKQQGVLQPILVRELTGSRIADGLVWHEIVAGERRWRAAKLAGLKTVPVVIRELDDKSALAIALIENLQRKDLNAIEIAESLARLKEEFGLTHQEVADSVGRSRSSVSNMIRLLELGAVVRSFLVAGKLDMGHARALLPLDVDTQGLIAEKIEADSLSVRDVERLVAKHLTQSDKPAAAQPTEIDTQTRWLQHQLANELGTEVAIRKRKDGGRTIGIDFDDLEQLETALQKIQGLIRQVRETAGPRVRKSTG